ncbi:MAG: hypothetical protein UZ04_CHB001001458 [Chlorobi bacterium OLB4]|jgi:hypothetical protein|nr:MAG: hypothetical protein UZ04_CHB001001458 [Chlorobi bacterium OLB4]MBV6399585.1 hypothetical protein [Ignavibacteria bacterium]
MENIIIILVAVALLVLVGMFNNWSVGRDPFDLKDIFGLK